MQWLRFGSFALAAAVGCGDNLHVEDEGDSPSESTGEELPAPSVPDASVDGALRLLFVAGDGSSQPDGLFTSNDRVHLRVALAEGGTSFHDGDLAYVVLDAGGNLLSSDALDCRRIRASMNVARIDLVYAGIDLDGAACQHGYGVHDNGTLLPRLLPYADGALVDGVATYTVRVARVEQIVDGVFPADAASGTFRVQPPVCGDGHAVYPEECDDGNLSAGDGCSASCGVEACGNGRLDPYEACDDGNTVDGDGCAACCQLE